MRPSSSSTASPVITRGQTPAVWRSMRSTRRTSAVMSSSGRRSCASCAPERCLPTARRSRRRRLGRRLRPLSKPTLDAAAARRLDPGAPALHRLNRTEYSNAIRDLLALDVDVSALLPPDDSTAGFDNIADVLGVSPALIEGYVAAAAKISRLAVGDPSIGLDRVVYRVPGDLSQDTQLEGLPHRNTRRASSFAIRSRSTPNTTFRSRKPVVAHGWAERRRRPAGAGTARTWRSTAFASRCRGAAARGSVYPRGLTPLLPRPWPVIRQPARTASSTSRRAPPVSRRSPLPARTTQRVLVTRQVDGGCSSARPLRPRTRSRARAGFCRRSLPARIEDRLQRLHRNS